MNKIMIIKVNSGEEILGEVVEVGTTLKVKNPMVILARPDPSTGQMSVGLMPFAPFSDDKTVDIYPHAIVADYTPEQEMLNEYNRRFGSGIVIAAANDLPQ
jgi:hypothetical protein